MSEKWYEDDDPGSLAKRVERVLVAVRGKTGDDCAKCDSAICGHHVVMSIVAGHEDRPLCHACMAVALDREPAAMLDAVTLFIHSKPCLIQGWRYSSTTEGFDANALPTCIWPEGRLETAPDEPDTDFDSDSDATTFPTPADHLDAGDQGCGDLVLTLRIRLNDIPEGAILRLTATDPGAPEDIPAWCRLTGNPLMASRHPDYFIKRKESS